MPKIPKKQAVLLGIASTIMPVFLNKYSDFLAIDSTGRRNSLNFPNTAFMVRSDEPRDDTITLVFLKFIQHSIKNSIELNPKWLAIDKWDPYLAAARKHFPNMQVVLCDWHEGIEYFINFDSLNGPEIKKNLINEKFWRGEEKLPTTSRLQREMKKVNIMGELLYKKNLVQGKYDTWNVSWFSTNDDTQHTAIEMENEIEDEMEDIDEENFKSNSIDECNIKQQTKTLCITHRSGKFACPCGFNVIRSHECQDIVAVRLFIDKSGLQKSAAESVASSSLESYLLQKDANGHNKNELKLPGKRVQFTDIIGYVNEAKKNQRKTQVPVLPESSYFETCFKNWQESHIVPCSAEFKAINEESIPENAFKIDKYTLVETGDVKYLYLCAGKVKSTRQIDQRLPLILVINVTGISITDEEIYLENKDLPEEIDFPSNGVNKNKDVHFENVKNAVIINKNRRSHDCAKRDLKSEPDRKL
ncbi:hypothetical protein C2G38_2037571 [Gigaspora rosea]|uniref:SWIM-type domain-containing protein n=1 Tax=Gigaspora rosea TaxID=44941 RepID=A0A397VEA2_9GLOM|nr:hypothetical protein C2G38_2037571 [Gigaspora rosea]